MAFQNHPSVLPLLVGGVVLGVNVGYLVWRKRAGRRAPGQLLAAGLVACFAISVTAFGLEQASTAIGPKLFWNKVQYLGDAPLTAFLLAYVLVYIGYEPSWRTYGALAALPALTIIGVFTNNLHHLYWRSLTLGDVAGYVVLNNDPGPLFYIYIIYTYVFLLGALALLVRASVESRWTHRRHLLALGVGTILPAIGGIAYVLGLGPTPTPNYPGYAYLLTAAAITYAVHRYDVFSVLPIARRTTLEQMDDGVITIDQDGIILGANDSARTILAADSDTLVGRQARDVLGEFLEDFNPASNVQSDSASGSSIRREGTVETTNGAFDITIQPLTREGMELGSLVVFHDVTDRHQREQRLAELNTRLELTLEETDTGIWEWNLETDEIVWDETSERLYGYAPGEFPETYEAFADRVVNEDLSNVEQQLETAIQTDSKFKAEFRIQLPDGKRRWIQARGVSDEDDSGRLFGIQTNITDRKERVQALEEKTQQLELLTQIVRHDIRNEASLTLNLIRGLDQSARLEQTEGFLSDIEQSVERIVDLTDSTRDLFNAVSQLDDTPKPIALEPALERAVAVASDRSSTATVQVSGTIPDVELRASDAISSVFRNLLTNALQHNDQEECQVVVSATEIGDMVRVTVADDGPGIPDEHKASVFQEGRTLADSDGTGFGLYLVQTIVEAYGGTVEITDREPRGTVVSVELPVIQTDNEPGPPDRSHGQFDEITHD